MAGETRLQRGSQAEADAKDVDLEFDLSRERALELYASGRSAAEAFLDSGRDVSAAGGGPHKRDLVHPRL